MCILFWTVDNHPKYRFNRDEFLERPTARAHYWNEPHGNVLAGTDLEVNPEDQTIKNGTWLGITKDGRFSALTNYREKSFKGHISRGILVRDFLWGNFTVHEHMESLLKDDYFNQFGGFNLIDLDFSKKDTTDMAYISNREHQSIYDLKPGEIYGLSNSILTNPWPKVVDGKKLFEEVISKHQSDNEDEMIKALFQLLSTTKPMTNTGDVEHIYGDLKERICIPLFNFPENLNLKNSAYATRTSTVVLLDYNDNVTFIERMWYNEDDITPATHVNFNDKVYRFTLNKKVKEGFGR
ncbi:NRDE protein-domain-containing protein [Mycotypha africana]|uniref:NRDE protein-domain-containing protein n=1 Tax=Mycotypha africana TaxID=64632 RepID=UPI002301C163|nr:NRDE protein-domain-containing protein [Mycotypha africana]KAI8977131.1 NRDE protein-domain-containing protein [Mycotypha africana]